jgi:hypothetical protein
LPIPLPKISDPTLDGAPTQAEAESDPVGGQTAGQESEQFIIFG